MHLTRIPRPTCIKATLARALVELLTDHPQLAEVRWDINESTALAGRIHSNDSRALFQACLDVFGGTPTSPYHFWSEGLRVSEHLLTSWRDIPVSVSAYSSATAYPELTETAVAA
jgi:hypothetical protein